MVMQARHSVNAVGVWMHVDKVRPRVPEWPALSPRGQAGQGAGPGQACVLGAGHGGRGHAQHRGASGARRHGHQAAGARPGVHGGMVVRVRVEQAITIHWLAIN